MQAYMNDVTVRNTFVARMKAHAAADELIRGQGWENGKGCAIGCMFHAYDHTQFPAQLGLPEWLGRLVDAIFEGLPKERAMRWPVEFLEAVPVGIVIDDDIKDELAALRLESLLPALVANQEGYARECEAALRGCIAFLRGIVKTESARSARAAARSAAESAARSARSARAAARSVAGSAAWSAESAWSVAWSAARAAESAWYAAGSAESVESARSAAGSAAWSAESARAAACRAQAAAWEREADTLLALLGLMNEENQ